MRSLFANGGGRAPGGFGGRTAGGAGGCLQPRRSAEPERRGGGRRRLRRPVRRPVQPGAGSWSAPRRRPDGRADHQLRRRFARDRGDGSAARCRGLCQLRGPRHQAGHRAPHLPDVSGARASSAAARVGSRCPSRAAIAAARARSSTSRARSATAAGGRSGCSASGCRLVSPTVRSCACVAAAVPATAAVRPAIWRWSCT